MLSLVWEATLGVVFVVPCSPPLGTEFLPLEPRRAYNHTGPGKPHGQLTFLVDSMSHIVRAFHLAYALKMFSKEEVMEVHHNR